MTYLSQSQLEELEQQIKSIQENERGSFGLDDIPSVIQELKEWREARRKIENFGGLTLTIEDGSGRVFLPRNAVLALLPNQE